MFNSVRKTEGIRFNATTPDGVHKSKYFSFKKYSERDILTMGEDWTSAIRSGLPEPKWKFVVKKEGHEDDSSSSDEEDDRLTSVKPFELELPDRKFGCSILLCGSSRSGKSTAVDYIFKNYFEKDYISILHTQSLQSDAYKEMKKKMICSPMYLPQVIEETYQVNSKTNNKYEFLHILDDVVNAKNDRVVMKMLTIMRNSRISCIISAQDITMFNSTGRGNINFVCLFRMNSDMAIEKVIRTYLQSWFPSHFKIRDMIREYKRLTADHHFFLIDNLHDTICLTKIKI